MAATWEYILVYDESETSIFGSTSGTVANYKLTNTIPPLIAYLSTLQNVGTTISIADLDSLVIFNGISVGFIPNNNTVNNLPQMFDWASIDTCYVRSLEVDILARLS